MILKIENTQREDVHGWRFVSSVEDFKKTSGFEGTRCWMRLEILSNQGKEVYDTFILTNEKVYLMNDEGRTIERLN